MSIVKKKRFFAPVLTAMAAAFMLSACSDSGEKQPANMTTEKDNKLALVVSTLNNPFFVDLKEGAEQKAQELGYQLVVLDSQNDSAREMTNIEDLTVQGVQLILLNPADSDAAGNSVMIANQAGIPVVTLDRDANSGEVASHVASDNVAGGAMAAELIIDLLNNEGQVIQLEGVPGTSAARERGAGFEEVMKNSNVKIVATQTADFDRAKALNVTENLLQANPDVKAIFAQNDEMALGAIKAVDAAKKDIIVVGFDGTEDGVNAVKSGEMTATVAQQAAAVGAMGVEVADQVLKGTEVEEFTPVELQLIQVQPTQP